MQNKLISLLMSVRMLYSSAAFAFLGNMDPKLYIGGELGGVQRSANSRALNDNIEFTGDQKTTLNNARPNVKGAVFDVSKRTGQFAVFAGSRLNENLGVELGYSFLGREEWKVNATDGTQSFKGKIRRKDTNMYADLIGYAPMNELC